MTEERFVRLLLVIATVNAVLGVVTLIAAVALLVKFVMEYVLG